MRAPARSQEPASSPRPAHRAATARGAATLPNAALALQRAVGNRAAAGVLARWTKHPDDKQKGVMVPDVAAAEYTRANPPKNA